MSYFCYIVGDDDRIRFYSGTHYSEEHLCTVEEWSIDPDKAQPFNGKWVDGPHPGDAPLTREQRDGIKRGTYKPTHHVNMAEEFAHLNGCYYVCGDIGNTARAGLSELLELHKQGPRIGQRIKVKGSGLYGGKVGSIIGYTCIFPTSLTHKIRVDDPPARSEPDEFGTIHITDKERLATTWCHQCELEVI